MSQLVIPWGFELVAFSWDRMPGVSRDAQRVNPRTAFVGEHLSALRVCAAPAIAAAIEHSPIEEEPERWDGLS